MATEDQTWWEEEKTISARVEDHGGGHLEQWFFSWGSFGPWGHVAVLKIWPIYAAAGWATGISGGARDAANCPEMHRTAPPKEIYPAPKGHCCCG